MRKIDRIIEVKVSGIYLEKDNRNAGVRYEGNVTDLRIEFDAGWDEFAKTVTFWNALMANPVKRVLTVDLLEDVKKSTRVYIIPIPPEAMTEDGMMSFVIDGYVPGKRKRSVKCELNVIYAPYAEDAEDPTDPTPSQAEQLQVQIDTFKDDLQQYAQTASAGATSASASASEAEASAEQAKQSAEQAAQYVGEVQSGGYVTGTQAQGYASDAERRANDYTDEIAEGKADITGDVFIGDVGIDKLIPALNLLVSGALRGALIKNANGTVDLGTILRDIGGGKQMDLIVSAADGALKVAIGGVEYPVYTKNNKPTASDVGALPSTGGTITGALTFDNPAVFSAFAKKRTVGSENYLMRVGVGSDGTSTTISLRLATVNQSGTETVVAQLDIDKTGVYWTPNGGTKRTIAHSGNIGLLSATVG